MEDTGLTRRDALKLTAFGAAALALPFGAAVQGKRASRIRADRIPRPYTLDFRRTEPAAPRGFLGARPLYDFTQRPFDAEILPGVRTGMWGYEGTYPGPTIRVERGTRIAVRQANRLPAKHPVLGYEAATSTHLHGSPSLPQYDGYANDLTPPGFVKDYLYDNIEEVRTNWYHDHAVHHTSSNVYMGLVGFYIVTDSSDAHLPPGEYDVPMVIADVAFTEKGQLLFDDRDTSGVMGDVIVVNGVPWPELRVHRRSYRFRMLNASVARSYRLRLSTGDPMTIISSDGGLLPAPVAVRDLTIGMAERYGVVVDFSRYRAGQVVELRNRGVKNSIDYDHTDKIMRFRVVDDPPSTMDGHVLPASFADDPRFRVDTALLDLSPEQAVRERKLEFERQGGEWTINGDTWADVEKSRFRRTVADPDPGDVELWTLVNDRGGWNHPVHLHLVDFRVLDRNGRAPQAYEQGPKDVVYLAENEVIRILARFGPHSGRYMIHCHNTSHEDHDMMSQFEVGETDDANDPLGVPARPIG